MSTGQAGGGAGKVRCVAWLFHLATLGHALLACKTGLHGPLGVLFPAGTSALQTWQKGSKAGSLEATVPCGPGRQGFRGKPGWRVEVGPSTALELKISHSTPVFR